jgi:uncharacterized protein (DUF433 family)
LRPPMLPPVRLAFASLVAIETEARQCGDRNRNGRPLIVNAREPENRVRMGSRNYHIGDGGAIWEMADAENKGHYRVAGLLSTKYEIIEAGRPPMTNQNIDWSQCPLVEAKPRVQSGAPVLLGTRMPVDTIVDNYDYGLSVAEIAEQFEIPPDRIEAVLTYAKNHRIAHRI